MPERSLRTRKKQPSWDAIATGGNRLFNEQGFAATTLEQIAEMADVHQQTALRDFKAREGIALAWHQRQFDKFIDSDARLLARSVAIEHQCQELRGRAERMVLEPWRLDNVRASGELFENRENRGVT